MYSGPHIKRDGLVFGYDTGRNPSSNFDHKNKKRRFFKGQSTTNLLSTPSINAYPTSGNSWGTYNTNQYNGNTYFSIGTVSSVTNNIVTMSGNHPLRTFDVVMPQTTGGGVTAGVNYFIKKISNTQFSLHAYNSSQDGSQGYINSETGFNKVHDSIANDQKVSINSSSFPTMWWGPPHLPNSGLVKELIIGGFKQADGTYTDCMRQHVTRDVSDHMAYNVNASITPNSPVYCSFWGRAVDQAAVGKSINFQHYTYGVTSATSYSTNATLGPVGKWRRFGYTFTSPNSTVISYWFNPEGPYKYDIANIQIEQNNRASPFVAGTRSSTQSLIDLTKTTNIDVSTVSFDSDGLPTFDGTDDEINTGITTQLVDFSCVVVFKNNSSAAWGRLVDKQYTTGFFISSYFATGGSGYVGAGIVEPNPPHGQSLQYDTSKYNYFVVTRSGTTHTIYLNGSTNYLSKTGSGAALSSSEMAIGAWNGSTGSQRHTGEIPVVKLYNRALTPKEIQQDFRAYKNRFDI